MKLTSVMRLGNFVGQIFYQAVLVTQLKGDGRAHELFSTGPTTANLAMLDMLLSKLGATASDKLFLVSGGKLDAMKCDIRIHPVPKDSSQEIEDSRNLASIGGTFSGYQVKNLTTATKLGSNINKPLGVPSIVVVTQDIGNFVADNVPDKTAHV